jgi:hypothetical protein
MALKPLPRSGLAESSVESLSHEHGRGRLLPHLAGASPPNSAIFPHFGRTSG